MPAKNARQQQVKEQLKNGSRVFGKRIRLEDVTPDSDSDYQYTSDSATEANSNHSTDDFQEEDAAKSLERFYNIFMGPESQSTLEERIWDAKFPGRAPPTGRSKRSECHRRQCKRELEEAAANATVMYLRPLPKGRQLSFSRNHGDTDSKNAQEETRKLQACKFEEKLEKIIKGIDTLDLSAIEEPDTTEISSDEDFDAEYAPIGTANVTDAPEPEEATIPDQCVNNTENVIESVEGFLMEDEPDEDILAIATKLLKHMTKVPTKKTLKSIMMPTAIISYEKLCQIWKNTGAR
ncbi:uncharacterized protein EI90DRAFT_3135624 [Cantharellus anzutake]|uniref:uncharacterized protein n=1 Tax=Cantharellus anzutake TaxID=1750568 RepID=UPI001907CB4C|nr:uncharacterized protein EI90DRAFT_3135624 [Cantharellus anzutake]KAF8314891.1 hypothetical protein EI90DRAFT_3135624 [Cantharellus anzutake]